jgi:3-oxoadipate enol-lactonase
VLDGMTDPRTLRVIPLNEAGEASGPLLVCLPGLLCPPEIFTEALRAAGLRGVGLAWLEGRGPFELAAVAARVRQAIAGLGPVVLVGHSMGMPIAVLAALGDADDGSDRIRGLVLANSGANTRGHGDIAPFVERVRTAWGPALWKAFVFRCLGGPVPEALLERMRGYPAGIDPVAVIEALTSQQRLDLLPVLSRLGGLPVAVVGGLRDPARPREHAEQLAAAVPGATLTLLDSGHTPCAEMPEAFAAVLRELVARCRRRA